MIRAAIMITVTAFTGWHMSDAFARAQADIRITQQLELIK